MVDTTGSSDDQSDHHKLLWAEPCFTVFWLYDVIYCYLPVCIRLESRLLDEAVSPLIEALLRHNGRTGHLRSLVRLLLEMTTSLTDPSTCER